MVTRRFTAPRGLDAAFLGTCLLLVAALVPGAVLRGEVLSQGQLLFGYAPWQGHAPAAVPPVNAFLVDPPLVFYPFLVFAVDTVRQGHFPVWSAGLYGGHPFLASFQAAVCSPFTLIAYLLPLPFATVPLALAPLVVGALGMRKFVASLGVGEAASWYGGLAWLLNGFAIVWFEHPLTAVACWLPWLLLAVERAVASPGAVPVAWLACGVAASILAGHPETELKVLLLVAAWAAHRAWRRPRAAWIALAAGGAAGVLLAAVQIVPFAEYLRASEALARRSAASGNTFFLPAETIVTALVPDFFGNPAHGAYLARVNHFGIAANYGEQQVYAGAVTALLAPVGLAAGWRDGRLRFFAVAGLAALGLMYGAPGLIAVVSHLPILRVSILTRFGLVAITCAIVLASRGVDAIVTAGADGRAPAPASSRRVLGLSLAASLACIAIAWLTLADALAGAGLAERSGRASIQAAVVLVAATALAWARARSLLGPRAFSVAICALVALELSIAARGFHPTIAPRDVLPAVPEIEAVGRDPGLFRVYGWGTALLPNTAMAFGLQDARGWDGVQPARYTRLLDLGYLRQSANPGRHLADPILLDLLNVKYVFVPPGVSLDAPRFTAVSGAAGVYLNTRAQPRAFLVDRYEVLDDRGLQAALHSHRADLRTTALLEREPDATERPERAAGGVAGAARVVHYRDTFVEIETNAEGRRLLVLGDAHYPGWSASVDGRPVAMHRADYALRAVAVERGHHVVRFEYRPWTVRAGAAVSGAQLLVLAAAVLASRRRGGPRG
jgi:hypothetical protein